MGFLGLRASLSAGAALALVSGTHVSAGVADKPVEQEVSEVLVTGSRVVRDGATAPTPVTVVALEQLQQAAPSTVADALNQLPVFQNSLRPSTTGSSATGAAGNGGNYLSLRSLGPNRTLVLLDGRRMPSNASGWTDVNLFPQLLLQRVDVVTGGASAAYGSDAVSGVVNFVLDRNFEGFKVDSQLGTSRYSDSDSYRLGVAAGKTFLDGRARLTASIEHYRNDGVGLDYGGRKWAEAGWGIIPNPAGPAAQIFARDIALPNSAIGSVISAPASLAGIIFGPGGQPTTFRYGSLRSTSVMSGGDGARPRTNLETSVETTTVFGRGLFEVSENLSVFAQFAGSRVETVFPTSAGSQINPITIFSSNAFLPASIQQQMTALNIPSFTIGRLNSDFGGSVPVTTTDTLSFTAGVEGKLDGGWSYSGYLAHGTGDQHRTQGPNTILENYYRAADAVRGANGAIVCRSTLSAPNDGCVPISLFGEGSPSSWAIDYVTDVTVADQNNKQDVAAFDLRGDLFTLPAGRIGFATGIEYRRESTRQTVDPVSASVISGAGFRGLPATLNGRPGGFWVNNPQPLSGSFNVKEAYGEVIVPLLKDMPLARSLDFNAAVRYADYSTAGGATTWKLGATYQPIEGLRLRTTRSRDVRAPNLAELFTSSQQTIGTPVRDPFRGGALVSVTRRTTGNEILTPEVADNFTLGAVYQPTWLAGFTAIVDYYDIKIKDAITAPLAQDIVDGCFRGDSSLCTLIQRDAAGTLALVVTPTLNVASRHVEGLDFEFSYRRELMSGELTLRALATYTSHFSETNQGVTIDRSGVLGPTNGVPEWRATFSARFKQGRLSTFAQVRWIDSGLYDNTFGPAQLSEQDNSIASRTYTDLTLTYDLPTPLTKAQVFVSVNNLFNQDPPIVPTGAVTTPRATNGLIYDILGRYYTVGARLVF